MKRFNRLLSYPLVGLIHVYRLFISPFFRRRAGIPPTCSGYALEAIQKTRSLQRVLAGAETYFPLPSLGRTWV